MLIRWNGLPVRSPCVVASQALKTSMWGRSRSAQLATSGWWFGEPGAELAQIVLDMRHRRRPQTQGDVVDVAARHLGDAWRDARPPAHRDRRSGPWPREGIEAPGMEQRELQSVEDGRHVASGTRGPAGDERVDDGRAGPLELGRADRIRGVPVRAVILANVDHCSLVSAGSIPSRSATVANSVWASGP